MNSSLDIQPLGDSDYAAARDALGRAFENYNLMVHACPAADRRLRAVTSVYRAILFDCYRHGQVARAGDCRGVACWLPPSHAVPTLGRQVRAGMLALPWHFGVRGFRTLAAYDEVARRMHHQYASMPHWFLAAIGVEPSYQGTGVGSALMRPMLERADRERLPCWLDTHQELNVRLYERHGFEVCERAELPGHPIAVYGMLRPPR